MTFVISLDSDWTSSEMLSDVANMLNQFNIHATFFLTNKTDFSQLTNHGSPY